MFLRSVESLRRPATNRRLIPNTMCDGYILPNIFALIRKNSSKLYLNSYNATIFDKNLDVKLVSLNIIYKNKY